MDIGKSIYNILSTTTAINNLVGTRIFPNVAAQSEAFPFIIYDVQNDSPEDTKDGVANLDITNMMVSSYSDSYAEATKLGNYIRDALDRYSGTNSGVVINTIVFDGYNDAFDDMSGSDGIYRKSLDFKIRIINT
jgi:hypothetical protein